MRQQQRSKFLMLGLLAALMAIALAAVGEAQTRPGRAGAGRTNANNAPPPANGTLVLDLDSAWRLFHVLTPPMVDVGGKLQAVNYQQNWLNASSAAPPATWANADFDDSTRELLVAHAI